MMTLLPREIQNHVRSPSLSNLFGARSPGTDSCMEVPSCNNIHDTMKPPTSSTPSKTVDEEKIVNGCHTSNHFLSTLSLLLFGAWLNIWDVYVLPMANWVPKWTPYYVYVPTWNP